MVQSIIAHLFSGNAMMNSASTLFFFLVAFGWSHEHKYSTVHKPPKICVDGN